MRKEEIVQVIRDYVNDDKAKYAVLIDGVWGCGKTYLYKNVLKDEISNLEYGSNEGKGNVYISLYGMSTVEQLAKEIITNYLLKVKLRGSKKKEKAYENVSKITGIISKVFSFSINGLSIDIDEGLKELKNNIRFKNMVVCFDDLERCSIPVNDLFGMINTLIEHCNCKVIILADEDNIGKMYANTNIEAKYLTLLLGRKLNVKKDDVQKQGGDERNDDLSVEELKTVNEKLYSENYIYKDIKEKVIGLSLRYTPCLIEEFDSIIKDTVDNKTFADMLVERKEKILEYMEKCNNNNIRIMRVWLLNFERIYKVIYKYYSTEEFFGEVFERFCIYTIRVACAIGKNKKLAEWEKGIEVGYIDLDDCFILQREGYKFVDDLYKDSVFDEKRICRVAKVILKSKQDEEIAKKELQKGKAYRELSQWYYLEDDKIKEMLPNLIEEISNGEYAPQIYQKIISLLIVLEREKYCKKEFIEEICDAMKLKIQNMQMKMDVENFQHHFLEDKELLEVFHGYYDPVYALILEKNRDIDKKEINEKLDYSTGEMFLEYCRNNYNDFFDKRSFMSYVDMKTLEKLIMKGTIEDIYSISSAFNKVYYFGNLYEFYSDDIERLETFKKDLEQIKTETEGNTRKKAIQRLIATVESKIKEIKVQ